MTTQSRPTIVVRPQLVDVTDEALAALQAWSGGLSLVAPHVAGGTAFFAHIGGFVFGVATVLLVAKQRPRAPTARFPVY